MKSNWIAFVLAVWFGLSVSGSYAAATAAEEQWFQYTTEGQKAYAQGNYREAARDFAVAVEQAEKCQNFDVRLAGTLNNLASVYTKRGQYLEAEQLLKRALGLWKNVYGNDHIRVGDTLYNIGLVADTQSSPLEAEPQRRRALWIYQQSLTPEQPELASPLLCLAYSFYRQVNDKDAELLINQVKPLFENLPGGVHAYLAICAQAQGAIEERRGHPKEAEENFKSAIAMYEKLGKERERELYTSLVSLAALLYSQGKYADAEPYFRKAFSLYENAPGSFYTTSVPDLSMMCVFGGSGSVTEMQYKRISENSSLFFKPYVEDRAWFTDAFLTTLKKLDKRDELADVGKRVRLVNSELNAYMRNVQGLVMKKWVPPQSTKPYTVALSLSVSKDGRISHLQIARSSGAERYDVSAIAACERAVPFPPLPSSLQPGQDIILLLQH
jgi:TonB family protein